MSKKKNKNAPVNKLKLILLGDVESDNINFIKSFVGIETDMTEKNDSIEFTKIIKEQTYSIAFNHLSEKEDKLIPIVQEMSCAFILFNMSERNSFDNILDKWLIWLRDSCKFEGKVIIFGDYQVDDNNSDIFLATSDDEVEDVMNCAEIPATFKKIGGLSEIDRRNNIDEILVDLLKISKTTNVPQSSNDGSMNKDCLIF